MLTPTKMISIRTEQYDDNQLFSIFHIYAKFRKQSLTLICNINFLWAEAYHRITVSKNVEYFLKSCSIFRENTTFIHLAIGAVLQNKRRKKILLG